MPNPMHDPRYAIYRGLLIELRERKALTQVDVATWLRKPQSYVSKYERGERRLDIIETIDVAGALGVDPILLLRGLVEKLGK